MTELLHDSYRRDEIEIPVDDVTMAATRYLPASATGPLPVLLTMTPYRRDDGDPTGQYRPLHEYLARGGYAVVVADVPGTGGSAGIKSEPFSVDEGRHGFEAVNWLADRDWSTGRIGMFGKSYRGKIALHTAARRPDSLAAIVPIMAPHYPFDHSRYPGGAMSFKHVGGWLPRMHTFAALPPSNRTADPDWADVWRTRLDALETDRPWLFQQLDHRLKDQYWAVKDVDIENIDVPTLAVGGFRDYFPHATLAQARAADAPSRVIMGPWRHTMPHRGRECAIAFRSRVLDWFDHFLTDRDATPLDHKFIEFWTEDTYGDGRWRARETWPTVSNDAASTKIFALTPLPNGLSPVADYESGTLEAEYEFDHTVGIDSIFYQGPPTDTNHDDARSLLFETPPLSQSLELTGTGRISLRLASTAKEPIVAARLVDVYPDGSAYLVGHGHRKANLRKDFESTDPLRPGEEHEIELSIRPISHVFETGHRLRLALSAGYFPRLLPSAEHGSYTVFSSPDKPSTVTVPGESHDGTVSFNDSVRMPPPDDIVSPNPKAIETSDRSIERARESYTNNGTYRSESAYKMGLPHGPTMKWEQSIEWSVCADDPTTAAVTTELKIELEYANERIEIEGCARTGQDTATIEETARIDGTKVFDQQWRY